MRPVSEYSREIPIWPARLAILLFVFGTARYVARDEFHADDSTMQAVIELSTVHLATLLSLGAAVFYRPRLSIRLPYLMLVGTLLLAIGFSFRSWDPALSLTRGALLVMISASAVALLFTYGAPILIRQIVNSYVLLILCGFLAGLLAPDDFPLMFHDPGEEMVRVRLHLFAIHPVALADDCALCLVASSLLWGKWIRFCRLVLVVCLLLTVTRTSIVLGLICYLLAEVAMLVKASGSVRYRALTNSLILLVAISLVGLFISFSDYWVAQDIRTAVTRVVDATKDNVTLNGRTPVWVMLINDLSWDNLLGYGIGGARYYLRTVNPWFSQSHNSALETIYVAGYVGLVLMIVGLLSAFLTSLRSWRDTHAPVMTVTLLYLATAGMMNPSWYETSSLIVLSVVLCEPWNRNRIRVQDQFKDHRPKAEAWLPSR